MNPLKLLTSKVLSFLIYKRVFPKLPIKSHIQDAMMTQNDMFYLARKKIQESRKANNKLQMTQSMK